MSRLIAFLFLMALTCCKTTSDNLTINGSIIGYNDDYLYLYMGKGIIDSSFVKNSSFSFRQKLVRPSRITFYTSSGASATDRNVYVGNDNIVIELSLEKKKTPAGMNYDMIFVDDVIGSKLDSIYISYQKLKENTNAQTTEELLNELLKIAKNHPDNPLSADLLYDELNQDNLNQKQLLEVYDLINWKELDIVFHRKVRLQLFEEEKLEVGEKLVAFELPNSNGNKISSDAFKDKTILIDFWASWCKPCREEFPNFKTIYKKYGNDKFELISISIDDSERSWIKALENEDLPWINLIAENGFKSQIALNYNIIRVPTNYLIDANGIIVAKDISSKELEIWLKNNLYNQLSK